MNRLLLFLLLATVPLIDADAQTDSAIVRMGAGSFSTRVPPGARSPQSKIYRTAELRGPMPTSDWWSSLAWLPFSEPMYAHPLVLKAQPDGLRVWHPSKITANKVGLFGVMPAGEMADLVLAHSQAKSFPDARVAGFSDWFVTTAFDSGSNGMKVSFGHGSPFVFATYHGGEPVIKFGRAPKIWFGTNDSAVLGVTVGLQHYGLFGPSGSRWAGLDTPSWTNHTGDKPYFSVAALPDNKPATLERFRRHAYAHVTDTKVTWSYDSQEATITTRFELSTKAMEGAESGTIFALYPHQWRHTDATLSGISYASVRGPMKVAEGNRFVTRMKFPGILPVLPNVSTSNTAAVRSLIDEAAGQKPQVATDTYWDGKNLGRLATLMQIARQVGAEVAANDFQRRIRQRLETWLSATNESGQLKRQELFYHDTNWGTLIGCKASYGSDVDLSDHAFHYGYFVQAAAALALADPAWARAWGPMVELLASDMAGAERDDPRFPFLRVFDPYAGHSWASGTGKFFDGNNEESSSEAVNAWAGLTLWGEATGNRKLRDLGAWLFTTELAAIEDYWFDVQSDLRPKEYTPSVVTMVWGGKSVNETWFSPKPEDIHMINWLPFTGASLYLGRYPGYVRRNYDALVREVGGHQWRSAADLILMYRTLDDPEDAWHQYQSLADRLIPEAGNSKANLQYWIRTLQTLGHVDRSLTANLPTSAAFIRTGHRTYVVYNSQAGRKTVTFSDGTSVDCPEQGMFWKTSPGAGPQAH